MSYTSFGLLVKAVYNDIVRRQIEPERLRGLVDAIRRTQEIAATAVGLWTTIGDPDELLAPYEIAFHLRQTTEMTEYEPTFRAPSEEFLNSVFERYSSERFKRHYESSTQSRNFERLFAAWVREGRFRPDEAALGRGMVAELHSARAIFDGPFIQNLRRLTLSLVGADRDLLEPVAVVMCPTHSLNATVLLSPEGEAVIVLNLAVLGVLQLVIKATLAYMTWHNSSPYCRDSPQDAYGAALLGLADFIFTGDFGCIDPHRRTLRFDSVSDSNRTATRFAHLGEMFIVLHEYGHLREGHLRRQSLTAAPDREGVAEYTRQQQDEFEADTYAIGQFVNGPNALDRSVACLVAGFCFRFFALCEARRGLKSGSRTHPPAAARWGLIKERTASRQPTETGDAADLAAARMVQALDLAFDKIEGDLVSNAR
jgi:hypothetical protein